MNQPIAVLNGFGFSFFTDEASEIYFSSMGMEFIPMAPEIEWFFQIA